MESREIKFRIWNGKEMEVFILDNEFDCHVGWLKNSVLMQSTGLTDKNGVEIFEGDIVCEFMAIRWSIEKACFEFYWTYNSESCDGDINWCEAPEFLLTCEIKGNIFEHPNLIK